MMHDSHTGHRAALATLCHPLRQQRQKQYLKRLNRLTLEEGEDYLAFYDALANRHSALCSRLEAGELSSDVVELAQELADLVQEIAATQARMDQQGYCQLHSYLDDVNVAVNAWKNHICVGQSGLLYGLYRNLQQMARCPSLN